nr:hypothetical protein [Tanacetum cinerariifolium]
MPIHIIVKDMRTMEMTIDQQVALDEALVPHASRLRIGKSNFRLRSDITSKELTLQLVYDVLRLTPFYKAFLVTADGDAAYMSEIPSQTFDELPFEEEILAYLRFLGHSEEIRKLTDVNINMEGRDVQMTNVHTTQEFEDTHVTLTPVNPDGQQQSSSVSTQYVTSMLNPSPDDLPNFGSLFGFDHRLKTLEANFSEFVQTNQFAGAVSSILGIVDRYMDQRMNEAIKIRPGSKRRREGKEPESISAPKEKTTKTSGKSTQRGAADDQPIAEASQHPEWFQTLMKPPTPDRAWNKTLPATHGSIQPWISDLAKQADSRSSFNELMDTPSLVELEFLEEVYKATTDQLDWNNPEGQRYPHNLLKRLPLIPNSRGCRVILLITSSTMTLSIYVVVPPFLNLTKPDMYRSDLKRKEAYTAYSNPRGFIYQNKDKQNRLMRIDELHKFSDGTLNDVRTALDDHLKAKDEEDHAKSEEVLRWEIVRGRLQDATTDHMIYHMVSLSYKENCPPMLNKDNYVSWLSRIIQYARSRPNGKMTVDSIENGPYVRRMIATPGEPDLPVPVPESLHEQTYEELTETDIKRMDEDNQAIQTILLGLPEDVYAAVDSCKTAKEIWERVR